MAKAKPQGFAAAVEALGKAMPVDALGKALGALVNKRLVKPVAPVPTPTPIPTPTRRPVPTGTRRRARRIHFKAYSATGKRNDARPGTFRHYMINVIRGASNTSEAQRVHILCDNAKFAGNKLDFNWTADNGYITFS